MFSLTIYSTVGVFEYCLEWIIYLNCISGNTLPFLFQLDFKTSNCAKYVCKVKNICIMEFLATLFERILLSEM